MDKEHYPRAMLCYSDELCAVELREVGGLLLHHCKIKDLGSQIDRLFWAVEPS